MPNPLKLDPTRTTTLRNRFMREMRKRFRTLKQELLKLVVEEDAFGLKTNLRLNTRWLFESDPDKVSQFLEWLNTAFEQHVLEAAVANEIWTSEFVQSAYQQASLRSFLDAKQDLDITSDLFEGTQRDFLETAFTSRVRQNRLELLYTRTFEQLKGISGEMSKDMSRILTEGLAHGQNPRQIARELSQSIDKLTRTRALVIARTEIIHAYAEGQLDTLEDLGVEEVAIFAEWSTAGDDKVCPQCGAMEGTVFKIKEARGLIPRHPNCRCAWIPADGIEEEGQRRTKRQLQAAIKRSVRGERKRKRTLEESIDQTTWTGVDLL